MSEQSRRCNFVKPDGTRCRANTRLDSKYCFFHDSASKPARDAARKAGGVSRSRQRAVVDADAPDIPLATSKDVMTLLSITINELRKGQIDTRIAGNVGYLASILLTATKAARTGDTHSATGRSRSEQ